MDHAGEQTSNPPPLLLGHLFQDLRDSPRGAAFELLKRAELGRRLLCLGAHLVKLRARLYQLGLGGL